MEYSGIKPNPVIEDVDAAAKLGRTFKPDLIVAVGGGSVIDSAKIISITTPVDHSGWLFMNGKTKPKVAVPLIGVLTLAATGTEMNQFAVVQNNETKEKPGFGNKLIYPRHSFLDPSYTITVPKDQTANGIADLTAHALENYFGEGDASLSDRFVYAIIHEAMEFGPQLMENLSSYDLRARIMYAATSALNGLTQYGRVTGDWGVHDIGHVLSILFDTPHGATLSVVYPAWLKQMKHRIPDRITELGKNLFGTHDPDTTIAEMERYFRQFRLPVRLKDIQVGHEKREEIISLMNRNKVNGSHLKISPSDVEDIVDHMYSN